MTTAANRQRIKYRISNICKKKNYALSSTLPTLPYSPRSFSYPHSPGFSLQIIHCWFLRLFCLRPLYMEWPSPSSPTETLSGLQTNRRQLFFQNIDLPFCGYVSFLLSLQKLFTETLSFRINETLKWLTPLLVIQQNHSGGDSEVLHIGYSTPPPPPPPQPLWYFRPHHYLSRDFPWKPRDISHDCKINCWPGDGARRIRCRVSIFSLLLPPSPSPASFPVVSKEKCVFAADPIMNATSQLPSTGKSLLDAVW